MGYEEFIANGMEWILATVLKNVVLFALPVIAYLLYVRTPNDGKEGGYSIPGRYFHFKRLWALFYLHKLSWSKKKVHIKNSGNGLLPSNDEIQLEQLQNLNNKYGYDTTLIFGVDNKSNMLILRISTERLKHRLHPEVWVHACIDGEIYQLPMHPDSGLPSTGPASNVPPSMGKSYSQVAGLKFEICEPMRKWRIFFNGMLRKGCHKEMTSFDSKELVHVKFNFIWTACSEPFYVYEDRSISLISEAVAREPWSSGDWRNTMKNNENGYDQWGTLYGEWKVGELSASQTILYLRGIRRRRWRSSTSPEDYDTSHHKAEFLGVSESGSFFSVGASSKNIGGLTHEKFGHYRSPAGIISPINSTDISLPHLAHFGNIPEHAVVRFSANGRNFVTSISFLEMGNAVMYTGRPWKYKTCLALMDFSLNSEEGYGISEFVYRYDGPCPISSQETRLMLQNITKLSIHFGEALTKQEKEQLEESKPLSLHFDDPLCQNSKIVGGKGSSLAITSSLADAPFKVPNGFCVTIFGFRMQVESCETIVKVISEVQYASLKGIGDKELQAICKRVVDVISSTPLCLAVAGAIKKGLEILQNSESCLYGFAVRSSALGEDSQELSAAGQNATILGCKTHEQVLDAVRTCWASLFAFPSVNYRRQHGMVMSASDIAVVIQQMVPADLAGVMFTQHPYTGNPANVVITANYGLGESVVAAIAEPDTVILSRSWEDTLSLLESKIGEKSLKVTINENDGGTKEERVAEKLLQKLCLSSDQAISLGHIGLLLESVFGTPRDIEWAIIKDTIFILQARPITAIDNWTDFELLHEFDTPIDTDLDVMTVANTGEVIPGPMTPLTSSVMAKALDLMIQNGPAKSGNLIPHYLRNAVITHHQLAMNVINCFFQINEEKISLSNKVVHLAVFGHPNVPPDLHRLGVERHGVMGPLDKLCVILRLLFQAIRASKVTKNALLRSQNLNLHSEKYTSAKELYDEITTNLISVLNAALDHNFVSSIGVFSQVILMKILTEGSEELTADHYADISLLLSSCSNIVSAEIPKDLKILASKISKSDGANEFCDASAREALKWFDRYPGDATIYFKDFLSRHGHRCLREFDLQSQTWEMKPDCLMSTLQTMVKTAGIGQEKFEEVVEGCTSSVENLKTPKKRGTKRSLRWLLPWCRRSVARREETKSALVRTLHALRLAYRRLGYLAQMEGVIPDQELIFYFTHYEICQLIENRDLSNAALLAKASRRRRLKSQWEKIVLPEVFRGLAKPKEMHAVSDENLKEEGMKTKKIQVTGTSASIGCTVGRACVISSLNDADQICPDDILITKSTDICWSPYFPLLSGIVTEMGGLISHGAVVAREYGLPCIVGASMATSIFKTGDRVKLDASMGVLKKIVTE